MRSVLVGLLSLVAVPHAARGQTAPAADGSPIEWTVGAFHGAILTFEASARR